MAGTHGKLQQAVCFHLFLNIQIFDPSFVVGGRMPHLKTNSKMGKGDFFIAELDESDGTVELYSPDITVITNLEYDHPDHYTDGFEQILETLKDILIILIKYSKIVINAECAGNLQLLERVKHSGVILYSIDENNTMLNIQQETSLLWD